MKQGERGPVDMFFSRVMFPIRDRRGTLISFGGRIMGDGQPKYVNGPETALFSKRRSLYGLKSARDPSARAPRSIIVEGYMDVIALSQAGFGGAVAPLGTALTEEHLEEIWRLSPEPVSASTATRRARRAALKTAELALTQLTPDKSLKFLNLPAKEDPDSLIKCGGAGGVRGAVGQGAAAFGGSAPHAPGWAGSLHAGGAGAFPPAPAGRGQHDFRQGAGGGIPVGADGCVLCRAAGRRSPVRAFSRADRDALRLLRRRGAAAAHRAGCRGGTDEARPTDGGDPVRVSRVDPGGGGGVLPCPSARGGRSCATRCTALFRGRKPLTLPPCSPISTASALAGRRALQIQAGAEFRLDPEASPAEAARNLVELVRIDGFQHRHVADAT